jgi:hypothetical protein
VVRAARRVLVTVGTLLIVIGTIAGVVNREALDADRFAAHVEGVRSDPYVARQVGTVLTDRLLESQPDLTAVRPLLLSAATSAVASPALGPAVRSAVTPLYRAMVTGSDEDLVVLRLADVAAVVVGVLSATAPQVPSTIPPDLDVRLSRFGGRQASDEAVVGWVHLAPVLSWSCPLIAILLLGLTGATGGGRAGERRWSTRLLDALAAVGRGALAAGVCLSALLVLGGFLVGRGDRETLSGSLQRAVWGQLDGAFWAAAALTGALGFLLTLPARYAPVAQTVDLGPRRLVSHAWRSLLDPGPSPRPRATRALFLLLLGVALVLQPLEVVRALVWALGLVLAALGLAQLAPVALGQARARLDRYRGRAPGGGRARWVAVGAAGLVLLTAGWIAIGAFPADETLAPSAAGAAEGACNGQVELCDRPYDDVAYPATHNAMAAANERGWFFAEQPDGIIAQLDHGIRVLLIDSWYGQHTPRRGVIANTDASRAKALKESRESFGESAVNSALRLRDAFNLTPKGPVGEYLCHGLCELGSTPWLPVMKDVAEWLASHPREVVTLFVQDEVSPADTARIVRKAGLQPYVYTPVPGSRDWPTLGQMIDSGKRLVLLMERRGGGTTYPWLLDGFDWAQDTPFLFRRPGQFSCAPNRGPADATLFLLNHWITDKAREVSNATRVNARGVLLKRARQCQRERGLLPNFVAVDFYDRGDLMGVVDTLNGLG